MNKKSIELALNTVVIMTIAIIFLAIVLAIIVPRITEGGGILKDRMTKANSDSDLDGVSDVVDKCCQTPAEERGIVDTEGCAKNDTVISCK